ncbi:MAG: hypothetical protein APF81_20690 [Desulfosporosinus sp. BRH_c37]|nr:MAG: hypothetical protein APF81_20690 [Desulfosporosinus sp. BRH_c37]
MISSEERYTVLLTELGAGKTEAAELLAYNERFFNKETLLSEAFPLADQSFIKTWQGYCREAETRGVFRVLQDNLVQLSFPIQEGISQTEAYRTATRRGIPPELWAKESALTLVCPENLLLSLHQTPVGAIPVLFTRERRDFVTLVQALAQRNEAKRIPDSMGACMVKGYNNWGRIWAYKKQWQAENPGQCSEAEWTEEFQSFMPRKELYQDTFLILSDGYYSGIAPVDMDLSGQDWQELSVLIRREHEATHYFTQRVFGSAENQLLDELIADYMGIIAANGCCRADWLLRFMGLENYPVYREGSRLQNYIAKPPISVGAFKVLQSIVKKAADNLEQFDKKITKPVNKARLIMALCRLSLLDMVLEESFNRVTTEI